jgi:hypothetical protein
LVRAAHFDVKKIDEGYGKERYFATKTKQKAFRSDRELCDVSQTSYRIY